MINSQNLIDKICAKINQGGLTELQTCQTTGALNILSNPVVSVATFGDLPDAVEYNGRMIYVTADKKYFYAVNGIWYDDFTSLCVVTSLAWSWGLGFCGRLGNNSTIDRSSPVSVVGGFTDWCQVSAGGQHNLGVRTNGTAWAWGRPSSGARGDLNSLDTCSPVSVVGGFTDWCQVSTFYNHSLGLRTNGTAWSWGFNLAGQLGDNSTTNKSSPVSVVGGFTDWCQVSAGRIHSLGVRTNGTAWAWGGNTSGRFGDNSTIDKSSPVAVVGGFTDWCQVSAGQCHSLGVRTNGTAWGWGLGFCGRLGTNSLTDQSSPVSVVGGFTDWCQVSAGGDHSLGVRTNGTAWSWGQGSLGRLGDNSTTNKSSPVSVVGGFTNWCQVSAGCIHSLGVRTNGTAWAWGCGAVGQLGDNSTISRSSPVSVVGGFTDWCQVSAGEQHSLGLRLLFSKGF
jgi:alpha-tubulin suppressor-like RCC1 family protein